MERRRPAALTALTVIAIVLGALVVLGGFQQVIGLLFQESLSQLGQLGLDQPGVSPQMADAQRQMQQASLEVQRAWNPFNWVFAPLAVVFGLLLVVGGAMALKLNPAGRKLLAVVCGVGLLFDLARDLGAIVMTLQISRVMQEHMGRMVAGTDQQAEAIMTGMMGASMAVGVAFGGGWMLLKLGYYVWGLVALTRDGTRRVYEGG